jgi:hypothetical protein
MEKIDHVLIVDDDRAIREPRYIKTLRSEGYVFSASVAVAEGSP